MVCREKVNFPLNSSVVTPGQTCDRSRFATVGGSWVNWALVTLRPAGLQEDSFLVLLPPSSSLPAPSE